ncbi:MAG: rod shape-determining protein [Clostridiales Family XIII bacterium]|jgi:rod shape-determining protein MreB|nr:rod shape-determining protein [Clostridiales Family XIII bacterium]
MLFNKDIGIDLGTANTLIYIKGKGIVVNQPSVIAVDTGLRKILAVGREAKNMIGKTPEHIKVVRPLQDGVISDFEMTANMLRVFLKGILDGTGLLTRIRIVVGVPSGVTEVEKRAVEEVIRQMGARDVFILDEPMAAAIGCGLPVDDPMGCMIADIGGGTSDIAVIALGGIVTSTSLRHAGDKLNEAIIAYMRRSYDLLIGDRTAEELKIAIGCAYIDDGAEEEEKLLYLDAKGRDIITGLPKIIKVSSKEIHEALEEPIGVIIDGVKNTLEHTPPELAADIVSHGMVLSGGGGLIRGLDKLITRHTGLQVFIAENALEAVAEGTGKSLKNIEKLERYSSKKLLK